MAPVLELGSLGLIGTAPAVLGGGGQAIATDAAAVTQDMLLAALGSVTPQITDAMLAFYSSFAAKHSGLA